MDSDRVAFFWLYCDIGLMFDYKQSDFKDISDVKELFKSCKNSGRREPDDWAPSPMCSIYNEGWEFLIERFGYESLFEINREVGWLNTKNIELFKSNISHLMNKGKQK